MNSSMTHFRNMLCFSDAIQNLGGTLFLTGEAAWNLIQNPKQPSVPYSLLTFLHTESSETLQKTDKNSATEFVVQGLPTEGYFPFFLTKKGKHGMPEASIFVNDAPCRVIFIGDRPITWYLDQAGISVLSLAYKLPDFILVDPFGVASATEISIVGKAPNIVSVLSAFSFAARKNISIADSVHSFLPERYHAGNRFEFCGRSLMQELRLVFVPGGNWENFPFFAKSLPYLLPIFEYESCSKSPYKEFMTLDVSRYSDIGCLYGYIVLLCHFLKALLEEEWDQEKFFAWLGLDYQEKRLCLELMRMEDGIEDICRYKIINASKLFKQLSSLSNSEEWKKIAVCLRCYNDLTSELLAEVWDVYSNVRNAVKEYPISNAGLSAEEYADVVEKTSIALFSHLLRLRGFCC